MSCICDFLLSIRSESCQIVFGSNANFNFVLNPDQSQCFLHQYTFQSSSMNRIIKSNHGCRYNVAADIANSTLKLVMNACKPGASVVELCEMGDQNILTATSKVYNKGKTQKGLGFPTCISINNCVGSFSPLKKVKLNSFRFSFFFSLECFE